MNYINYARKNGWVPDWAWYQMNGKSATENYMEQKEIKDKDLLRLPTGRNRKTDTFS